MTTHKHLFTPDDGSLENEITRLRDAIAAETDLERLSDRLQEALATSPVCTILDETPAQGPGTLGDVLAVCRALGRVDASVAWIVGVANSAWSMRANFDAFEDGASLAQKNHVMAMVLGRPGKLEPDTINGGWRLTGSWAYASGARYASWFFCLATVDGAAQPEVRVVAAPTAAFRDGAPWNATGLRGTQSGTLVAESIPVPECNTASYARILAAANGDIPPAAGRASYAHLFTGVLMNCLQGAVLGAAEEAFDTVAGMADRPISGSTYARLVDSGAVRAEIGRLRGVLDMLIRAAEYSADVVDSAARNAAQPLSVSDRVDLRSRTTRVMRGAQQLVDDLLWIAGSSALNRGEKLERIWRDVNTGARHGGFAKLIPEDLAGSVTLGMNPAAISRVF